MDWQKRTQQPQKDDIVDIVSTREFNCGNCSKCFPKGGKILSGKPYMNTIKNIDGTDTEVECLSVYDINKPEFSDDCHCNVPIEFIRLR